MDTNTLISVIVLAVIAAVPGSIAAWQSRKNNTQNKEIIKTAEATATKVEEVSKQTADIHTATNGASLKMETKFDAATKEIGELRAIIKSLVERENAAASVRSANVKQTGELLKEVENGNTVSYTNLLKEVAELKNIMAAFAKTGMPVIAPAGEPLPVVAVKKP